jgi:hypothetical protein
MVKGVGIKGGTTKSQLSSKVPGSPPEFVYRPAVKVAPWIPGQPWGNEETEQCAMSTKIVDTCPPPVEMNLVPKK